jgi:LysR family hydrogen peroxide-inducible transcriptional activator
MKSMHAYYHSAHRTEYTMEMHQIRYFLAVAETLNFTRAAERCNVTQPALTRAIQKLEEELGGLLLRRERNLTHLSDLGRLMKPHLEQIFAESESAKVQAKAFLRLDNAPLNLGVMCTIGPLRFMGFLTRFRQDHPGVELTLREAVPPRLSELLLDGTLDVAVMAQPEAFDERLDVQTLYRERFVVAFPAGHRFERRNALRFPDMDGESYLQRINCEFKDQLGTLCRQQGAKLKGAYRSEREDWIQVMIAGGLGVCFTPEYSPIMPGVMTRPVVDPEVTRDVSLVAISGRRFSPAVTAFIKAIKSYPWPDEQR